MWNRLDPASAMSRPAVPPAQRAATRRSEVTR